MSDDISPDTVPVSQFLRAQAQRKNGAAVTKSGTYLYVNDLIEVTVQAVVTKEIDEDGRIRCEANDGINKAHLAPTVTDCTLVTRAVRTGDTVTKKNVDQLTLGSVVASSDMVPWVHMVNGRWKQAGHDEMSWSGAEMLSITHTPLIVLRAGGVA